MYKRLLNLVSSYTFIDIGTSNTSVCVKGRGVVLKEPSVVAIKKDTTYSSRQVLLAAGTDAENMIGRTPGNIETIQPIRDGVIANFTIAEKMLAYFISKCHKNDFIKSRPKVLIAVPYSSTQVEQRAFKASVLGASKAEARLIYRPIVAALGANLPINSARGMMIIDIGGGTTDIAIISLGGVVCSNSIRIGGNHLNENIINYIRRKYGIAIGDATAEKIKIKIGKAFPSNVSTEMDVIGQNLGEGLPRRLRVNSNEVLTAVQELFTSIVEAVHYVLEQAPPELASDISEHGITLTGGSALIEGLDRLLTEETGLPVDIVKDPIHCMAIGGGIALDSLDEKSFQNIMV